MVACVLWGCRIEINPEFIDDSTGSGGDSSGAETSDATVGTVGSTAGSTSGSQTASGSTTDASTSSTTDATDAGSGSTSGASVTETDGTGGAVSHTIFVTSTLYDGDLGGPAGADAACQARADGAGLPGTWRAIVSGPVEAARDRITVVAEVQNMNSAVVAADEAQLWSGTLSNPVQFDEVGQPISGDVWTGSLPDGTDEGSHCNDWTVSGGGGYFGERGDPTAVDGTWLNDSGTQCSNESHLYCISQ